MDKTTQNITIRIPLDLFSRLTAAAEQEHRSISSQVVHILSAALPVSPPSQKK